MTLPPRVLPSPQVTHVSIISNGDDIEKGIREVSQELVKGVLKESLPEKERYKLAKLESVPTEPTKASLASSSLEESVPTELVKEESNSEAEAAAYKRLFHDKDYKVTGPPRFNEDYATLPYPSLTHEFLSWYNLTRSKCQKTDEPAFQIDQLIHNDPAILRFFMAYLKPDLKNSFKYNLARLEFLNVWLQCREIKPIRGAKDSLFRTLKGLFRQWDWVADQLGKRSRDFPAGAKMGNLWKSGGKLGSAIKSRRVLFEVAEDNTEIKDRELEHWNSMWALTLKEQNPERGGVGTEKPATTQENLAKPGIIGKSDKGS